MSNYKHERACVKRRREWVQKQKNKPCVRCGKTYPHYVMEFHHRDPATKLFTIAWAVERVGRARIAAEIAKCDLFCANCHRIVEHGFE